MQKLYIIHLITGEHREFAGLVFMRVLPTKKKILPVRLIRKLNDKNYCFLHL